MWLRRDGQRISTLDLFDGAFVLVVRNAGGMWIDAAKAVAPLLAVGLRAYRIGPGGDWEAEGDVASAYGISETGAALVRPDGYVAWRCRNADGGAAALLAAAFAAYLRGS